MSEDEHDNEGFNLVPRSKEPKYKITQYTWRSPELHDWLDIFSLMHLANKWHADGRRKRGNWVRTRFLTAKPQTKVGRPVSGLPKNFYNQEWLDGLSPSQLKKYNIQPAIDLRIDPEIIE